MIDAATRSPTEERARQYHRWQFRLSVAGFLLAAAYLVLLLTTGAAVSLRTTLVQLGLPWWLQLPLALVALGLPYELISLPLNLVSGFWLPRRFGLLHQSFGRWLWDSVKGGLIGGGLLLIGAELVYGLMRATEWWWLWAAGVFLAGYALLAWVAPIWLLPLFYRLTPLEDGELRHRLVALANGVGVPVFGVWVADQSSKSRTANAAVTGLRGTRRIILFDTLIKEFSPDEVEVVLAHELAHHVQRDVQRGIVVQGALTLLTFWVADHALVAGAQALGFDGPDDLAGLPLFGLILMGVSMVLLPLANGWSRHVERQADDFALRVTGNVSAFISAMERLATLNLAERDPHPLKEFFLHSHPSIGRRIARARPLLRSSG